MSLTLQNSQIERATTCRQTVALERKPIETLHAENDNSSTYSGKLSVLLYIVNFLHILFRIDSVAIKLAF